MRNSDVLSAQKPTDYSLRPYQRDAVHAVFESWEQFQRTLLVIPTAGGKTIIFAAIVKALLAFGQRILILAHRDELIDQAIDKLHLAQRLFAAKEKASEQASLDAGLVVGSVQTLCRQSRLERFAHDHFEFIITDEAHHSLSPSYRQIYGHFPEAKLLGVTATPDRGDKRNLAEIYEDIAFEVNMLDLIKKGYLCQIRVETIPLEIDITGVKTVAGDYSADDLGTALRPWLEKIAEILAEQYASRKTLVFLPLISISEEFATLCRDRGLAAEHIDGLSPDRAEILGRFRRSETMLLSNAMLLTEGYDESSIDCVICLRPTKVRSLFAQIVGRGTRIHPGKDDLLILDFLWLTDRHDLVRPAQLMASSLDEAERIEAELDKAGGNLERAKELSDAALLEARNLEAERRRKLAEKLAHNRDRQRNLFDAMEFAVGLRDVLLVEFEPTMAWHTEKPSQKQLAAIARFGIDPSSIQSRGHASAILDKMVKRSRMRLATPRQLRWLVKLGHPNPAIVSFDEANAFLTARFNRNRATV
jgi:superfamily II DNA or RNA helicase